MTKRQRTLHRNPTLSMRRREKLRIKRQAARAAEDLKLAAWLLESGWKQGKESWIWDFDKKPAYRTLHQAAKMQRKFDSLAA